jgi:isocitrate lyase
LQEKEFASERAFGYEAVKHQRFVGTGYFDTVQQAITSGTASTTALAGSTEAAQFQQPKPLPLRAQPMKEMRQAAASAD